LVVVERLALLVGLVQQATETTLFWLLLHQPAVVVAEIQPMQIVAALEGEVETKEQAVLEPQTKVFLVALAAPHFQMMPLLAEAVRQQ
jgi:hypothetical protein